MNHAAGESQMPLTGSSDLSDDLVSGRNQSVTNTMGHSKKLSISFPVLRPNGETRHTHSPDNSASIDSTRSSPQLVASSSPQIESPDFLTLLASQERKVLELRDELNKAESDLSALKKQWASFEASKKKSELRQIAKLQPLYTRDESEGEHSAKEKREFLQRKISKPTRKSAQRVFSGSKHTRALSLLSPAPAQRPMIRHSLDQIASLANQHSGEDVSSLPYLERTNTTPSIETPKSLGKTYKDLSDRRSLPPPSTDAIVRQGKQMASDLKEGLWTFFEDIRQATVGDEAVNGTQPPRGAALARPRVSKQKSQDVIRRKRKQAANGNQRGTTALKDTAQAQSKETSFWKEFGMDTPHKHDGSEQASSDPLLDLDDDEAWEAWESPNSKSPTLKQGPALPTSAQTGNRLPWPELTNLTPSKLKRTVSDIMKDWDSTSPESGEPNTVEERAGGGAERTIKGIAGEQGQVNQQIHPVLASPHM